MRRTCRAKLRPKLCIRSWINPRWLAPWLRGIAPSLISWSEGDTGTRLRWSVHNRGSAPPWWGWFRSLWQWSSHPWTSRFLPWWREHTAWAISSPCWGVRLAISPFSGSPTWSRAPSQQTCIWLGSSVNSWAWWAFPTTLHLIGFPSSQTFNPSSVDFSQYFPARFERTRNK